MVLVRMTKLLVLLFGLGSMTGITLASFPGQIHEEMVTTALVVYVVSMTGVVVVGVSGILNNRGWQKYGIEALYKLFGGRCSLCLNDLEPGY